MSEDFKRQMWWMKKLGKNWRRPRGKQNKLRQEKKAKGRLPTVGYRTPRAERGLHPSGLHELTAFNVADVAAATAAHAVRIGGTVGTRKRLEIIKACDARGVRVLNAGIRVEAAKKKTKKEATKK
ncbi:MAG: 50S ribosomal protein L32e [Candidatus Aenigmarchaeota archaeon]|nr:50S ribosomal protein L32e [Candidatus Aenigmarchaeota archaeon]